MGIILKTNEIAKLFDTSRRTVGAWKRAGCPVHKSGGRGKQDFFDSSEVHRWLLSEAVGNGAAKDPEIREARLDILKTEGRFRELRLAQRAGELVDKAKVDFLLRDLFVSIIQDLKGLAAKLYYSTLGTSATDGIREVDSLLRAIAYSIWVKYYEGIAEVAGVEPDAEVSMVHAAWERAVPSDWWDWYEEQKEREGGPELYRPGGENGTD